MNFKYYLLIKTLTFIIVGSLEDSLSSKHSTVTRIRKPKGKIEEKNNYDCTQHLVERMLPGPTRIQPKRKLSNTSREDDTSEKRK